MTSVRPLHALARRSLARSRFQVRSLWKMPVRYAPCEKLDLSVDPSKLPCRSIMARACLRPALCPCRPTPPAPLTNSMDPTVPSLDLLPRISTHPSLANVQIRCGPRNTFNPSHKVRKRRHGFLARLRTRKGRAILKRRKAKGRSTLSH